MKSRLYIIATFIALYSSLYAQKCTIHIDSIHYSCFDNNTELDTTDDFYVVDLFVFNIYSGSSNEYLVYVQDSFDSKFQYGQMASIRLKKTNQDFKIKIMDADSTFCVDSIVTKILNPCSIKCDLKNTTKVEVHCNDAGTNKNPDDDFYSVTLFAPSSATKAGYHFIFDGKDVGTFPYNKLNYYNVPADKNGHDYALFDDRDTSCGFWSKFGKLITCSDECSLFKNIFEVKCDDNGSPFDIKDDVHFLDFSIRANNGSGKYFVFVDGIEKGLFSYDSLYSLEIAANNDVVKIKFEDEKNPTCFINDSISNLKPCSIDCKLFNIPIVDAGENKTLDCIIKSVELLGSISFVDSSFNFVWLDKNGNVINNSKKYTCKTPGTYYVKAILNNGCTSSKDSVIVSETITKPVAIIHTENEILDCKTKSTRVTFDKNANNNYYWLVDKNKVISDSLDIKKDANIVLIVTDKTNGCQAEDSISIKLNINYPYLNFQKIDTLDCKVNSISLDVTNAANGLGIKYNWFYQKWNQINATSSAIIVNKMGWYYVKAIDEATGCTNLDSIFVNENDNKISTLLQKKFTLDCLKKEALINAIVSTKDTTKIKLLNFAWTFENQQTVLGIEKNINVIKPGKYKLKVFDPSTGCTAKDSTLVVVNETKLKIENLIVSNEKCFLQNNGFISFGNITGGLAPYKYSFNGIEKDKQGFINLKAGDYKLKIVDLANCSLDTIIKIEAAKKIDIIVLDEIKVNYGLDTTLFAEVNLPDSMLKDYYWSPINNVSCSHCFTTSINAKDNETFVFSVTDVYGCKEEAVTRVRVTKTPIITYPNIISVSSFDNNKFTLYGNEHTVEIKELKIFDRWGNLMWTKNHIPLNALEEGWDGSINGKEGLAGVYTFYGFVEIYDGSFKKVMGDVTVVK